MTQITSKPNVVNDRLIPITTVSFGENELQGEAAVTAAKSTWIAARLRLNCGWSAARF